jgi:hypothetical protein
MYNDRAIWLSIMVLAAVFLGAGGGLLSWAGGMNLANAILAGSGAFGGSLLLMITVKHYLDKPDTTP